MADPVPNVGSLFAIFDRRRTQHRWLRALRELGQGVSTHTFVSQNWQMDHRVSQAREDEMLAAPEFAGEPDGDEWSRQRGEYFYRALCRPSLPAPGGLRSAYLDASNATNVVPRNAIPPHEQLVHGASLNRILAHLATAEHPAVELKLGFRDLTGRDFPQRVVGEGLDRAAFQSQVDEIASTVNELGVEAVRRLAGLLCDALGPAEPPWWAGFAQELMPLIENGDGTGLCQALGMGHLEEGVWLMLWRYEIGQLFLLGPDAHLYRPTVVEANDSPFHFPSPPGYPYGITMSLAEGRRGACREVIHAPLKGQAAVDACSGVLYRIARSPIVGYDQISDLRERHRDRLQRAHPEPETAGWLGHHRRAS